MGSEDRKKHDLCANNGGWLFSKAAMKNYLNLSMSSFTKTIKKESTTPCGKAFPRLSLPSGPPSLRKLSQQPIENRCLSCKKLIAFLGFKCRCGSLFCPTHRHPETHQCTFDYKKVGRDAIAKANPVVKADKLVRF